MRAPQAIKDATIGSLYTLLSNWLDLGAGVLILWYGGSIAMEPGGSISVGDLIKYQLYYNMMTNSIQSLTGVLNQFTRAAGAAERVLSLIDCKPDIDPFAGAPVNVAVQRWDLRFDGVTFWYQMRPKNVVLRDLSFAVDEGTVCALVGKSGGGKSTIVHLILRYYDPLDGRVTLGGVEYAQLNLRSVHERLGVVSQARAAAAAFPACAARCTRDPTLRAELYRPKAPPSLRNGCVTVACNGSVTAARRRPNSLTRRSRRTSSTARRPT